MLKYFLIVLSWYKISTATTSVSTIFYKPHNPIYRCHSYLFFPNQHDVNSYFNKSNFQWEIGVSVFRGPLEWKFYSLPLVLIALFTLVFKSKPNCAQGIQ